MALCDNIMTADLAWIYQNPADAEYWDTEIFHREFEKQSQNQSLRSTQRLLEDFSWLPGAMKITDVRDEKDRALIRLVSDSLEKAAKKQRRQVYVLQLEPVNDQISVLVLISN